MKKIIALILVLVCMISLFTLVGCGKETVNTAGVEIEGTIDAYEQVEINNAFITKVGKYYEFGTGETKEYLMFLNEFDGEQYEIVDISHNQARYIITYKEIK